MHGRLHNFKMAINFFYNNVKRNYFGHLEAWMIFQILHVFDIKLGSCLVLYLSIYLSELRPFRCYDGRRRGRSAMTYWWS